MRTVLKLASIFLMALLTLNVNGQVNLKDRLKKAVNNASQTIGNAGKNKENNKEQPEKSQEAAKQNQQEPAQPEVSQTSSKPAEPAFEAYSKYDFVPGEKIIFEDNQEGEENGEFPSRWDLAGGGNDLRDCALRDLFGLDRQHRLLLAADQDHQGHGEQNQPEDREDDDLFARLLSVGSHGFSL